MYERTPERRQSIARRHKEKYGKMKFTIINFYTKGTMKCQCPKCDVIGYEFMTIDHVKNNGNIDRKTKNAAQIRKLIIENNFPDDYQVLCYNCNCTKGTFGVCSHFR